MTTSITETAALAVPDGVPPMAGMTDDELLGLARACVAEQRRREVTTNAARQVEAIRVEYHAAVEAQSDTSTGEPALWEKPTGAHNSYPEGWLVTHEDHVWRNLVPGNDHEPGTSGWRIVPPEGEVAPYTPVSGAHDAYHRGDRVRARHDDNVYVCDADVCAHAPSNPDSGWVKQEEPAEPEQPEEPTDPTDPEPEPEEPTEPEPAPWAEGEVYAVGDLVTHEGDTYRCRQAHTAIAGWTPTAVPALWEKVA